MDPYPNVKDINSVKIVSHNRTYFAFGGNANNQVTNGILGFKDEAWSRVGSLKSKRAKFSVIYNYINNTDKVFVIGGQKKQKYETCNVTISNTVECLLDSSIDFEGSEEPVLFGVRADGSCDLTVSNYESKEAKELMILSNATFKKVDNFVPIQKTSYRNDK